MQTQTRPDGRPLSELVADLGRDTRTLVRQEIRLASTEMSNKFSRAGKDVGFIGASAAIGYAGFLAIVAAAIAGLAEFIPVWLSALVVGIVLVAVAYALFQKGKTDMQKIDPMPRRTLATLEQDVKWAKEQTP